MTSILTSHKFHLAQSTTHLVKKLRQARFFLGSLAPLPKMKRRQTIFRMVSEFDLGPALSVVCMVDDFVDGWSGLFGFGHYFGVLVVYDVTFVMCCIVMRCLWGSTLLFVYCSTVVLC